MIDDRLIPPAVVEVLDTLRGHGHSAFLVGGAVRDLVMGRTPKDFDIATSVRPQDISQLFPKVIETGIKHGTVTVLSGGYPVEVTTYRRGDNPHADALARDFTINALLYDRKELIDYTGGLTDIKAKLIRAVEDPIARFREDPLRMLRAVRFASQFEFTVELNTLQTVRELASMITKSAPERIREELVKILLTAKPSKGIKLLREAGLLAYILPELEACAGFNQDNPHHDKDILGHTLAVLDHTPPKPVLRLAALLHDIAKPLVFSRGEDGRGHFYLHHLKGADLAGEILGRFKFDGATTEAVTLMVREHMSRGKIGKPALKKLMARVGGPGNFEDLLELFRADEAGSAPPWDFSWIDSLQQTAAEIISNSEPLTVRDLAISGKDLLSLGVKPGPVVGTILQELTELVIKNPELNTGEQLLPIAHRIIKDNY